jgi:hypothetical protein
MGNQALASVSDVVNCQAQKLLRKPWPSALPLAQSGQRMNKHLTKALPLVIAASLLQGCATVPPSVRLTPSPGQELVYYKGDPCIESEAVTAKGPIWLSVCAVALSQKRASLSLRFVSNAQESIHLDEDMVRAQIDGQPVEVLGYTALSAEERKRQMWAAVGAGLAAAGNNMSAQQAGKSSYAGTAQTNVYAYGSGGYATAKATTNYSGTTYNAGAAYAAQANANAQNAQLMNNMQAQNALRNQQIGEALRTHTLSPGDSHGTYVDIEHRPTNQPQPIRVSLKVDDEVAFGLMIERQGG